MELPGDPIPPFYEIYRETAQRAGFLIRVEQAYDHILERRWDRAFDAFSTFIQQYPQSPYFDDAHFWHCYALEKKGAPGEEVFACYQHFVKAHPQSKWADDAQRSLIAAGTKLAEQGKTEYGDIVRTMQEAQQTDVALAFFIARTSFNIENPSNLSI